MKGSDPDQNCGQDPDSNGGNFGIWSKLVNYNVDFVFRGENIIYPVGEKLAFCKIYTLSWEEFSFYIQIHIGFPPTLDMALGAKACAKTQKYSLSLLWKQQDSIETWTKIWLTAIERKI